MNAMSNCFLPYKAEEIVRMGYGEYKRHFSDCETVAGSYIGGYEKSIEVIVPQICGKVTAKLAANGVICYYVDGKRVQRERVMYATLNPNAIQGEIDDTDNKKYAEKISDTLQASEWICTSRRNKNGSFSYFVNGTKIKTTDLIRCITYFYHDDWKSCREVKADLNIRNLLFTDSRSDFSGYNFDFKTFSKVHRGKSLDRKIIWIDEEGKPIKSEQLIE